MSVSGSITLTSNFVFSVESGPLINSRLPALIRTWLLTLGAGSGSGQINRVHYHTYPFVASTPQTLNLKSLTDLLGFTFTDLAEVRGWGLRFLSADDTATLEVGNDGTADEWVGTLTVGSSFVLRSATATEGAFTLFGGPGTTAIPVTPTSRLLKLLPSAHAFDVDFVVAGSS